MAEIPVEKRSGSYAWLWILLALLLVALLAWYLLSDDDDDAAAVVNDDVAAQTVPPVATTALMVGEPVDMENVRVESLAGDMAFYVDVEGERVPVFFDEVPTPGTPTEGLLDINSGMMVNLVGEVRAATDTLPEGADPSILGAAQHYIFATEVEPVS